MAEVYLFKQDGKIYLGTMKEGAEVVCKENLEGVHLCSKEELEQIPTDILSFCKETKQKYLRRRTEDGDWEATK